MEKLLTTILGEKCYFCGSEGRLVCYGCESKMVLCKTGVCIKCQKETVMGFTHQICQKEAGGKLPSQLCSIYEYGGLVAEIIKKSKYNPKRFALLKFLSYSGAKAASKLGYDFCGYTVIPVPISKARQKERGFNQAEIIAKAICKEFALTMNNSVLTRVRDTNKQFGLHKHERGHNVEGAFAVKKDLETLDILRGGKFLLVDDICTTGSTLKEVSNLLFSLEAADVRCFALSRKL